MTEKTGKTSQPMKGNSRTSSSSMTAHRAVDPSTEWPREVREKYDAVRVLGKGGFAAVMLARRRESDESSKVNSDGDSNPPPSLVAIKTVNHHDSRYGRREIDILSALPPHRHVMKLHESFFTPSSSTSKIVMALEYCPGPTLLQILEHRGAPSLAFCRVVAAQLVDAVSHLHSYAVIHRDIKPDNLIVTGYDADDPQVWDNEGEKYAPSSDKEKGETKVEGKYPRDDNSSADPSWGRLLRKWHVTLIDFGFARALEPKDLQMKNGMDVAGSRSGHFLSSSRHGSFLSQSNHSRRGPTDELDVSLKEPMETTPAPPLATSTPPEGAPDLTNREPKAPGRAWTRKLSAVEKQRRAFLDRSQHGDSKVARAASGTSGVRQLDASRHMVRSLSALGNRHYAAPEILKTAHHEKDHRHSLSEFVGDYGMIADAYSVGCTLRFLLTGVPPTEDVAQVIAMQNHPLVMLGRLLAKAFCAPGGRRGENGAVKKKKKKKQYRQTIPMEVVRMIKGMTVGDPQQRTSVRAARLYPWIDGVLAHHQHRGGGDPFYQSTQFLKLGCNNEDATGADASDPIQPKQVLHGDNDAGAPPESAIGLMIDT